LGALRQRFGQVSVNFGEPIRLASFLDEHQPDWRQNTGGPDFRPEWLTGVTNRLGTEVARHINEAPATNPVNLVAMVMLSTSKLAIDRAGLASVLEAYQRLLRQVPYSPHTTVPDGDGETLVQHVLDMELIDSQRDALGEIIYLNEQHAVLMTYYRNNEIGRASCRERVEIVVITLLVR